MQFASPVLGALALVLASGPAFALDSWTRTVERGLPVLSVKTAEGELRVICDPDRVFGPTPNGVILVELSEDPNLETIVFLAKTGEQARLRMVKGLAAQAAAEPGEWGKMVAILRAGGAFAVVSSKSSLTVDLEALPDLDCD